MGGAWPDALTRPFALLRRAPPELRLVYLVKALDSYGYFALSEVFTTYFSEFGVSDVAAGTYYGAWGTAITAYGVATGFAIDAMGVRRSLVACYALQTLARLILAFTTNKTVAVVVLFTIQSLATSWGAPVMTIAIKRLVADADRVVSFGVFYSVMNVSALLSGVAIDLLRLVVPVSGFEFFGVSSPIRGVVLSTVLSSALALVAATRFTENNSTGTSREAFPKSRGGSACLSRDPERRAIVAASSRRTVSAFLEAVAYHSRAISKTARDLASSRVFWQFLAMGLFTVNLKQVFRHLDATFPKFAVRAFGCGAPFGLIYAVNPAMIIAGVPVVAAATAHRKHFDMIFVGSWISATAPFFLAFSQTVVGAVAFVVVLSVGEMAWSPRWYDYTMACAPQGKEGVFGALALAPLFLAKLPTGILGGVLLQRFCPGRKGGDCVADDEGSDASRFVATNGSDASDGSVASRHRACDGFAVWGVIGLVTATSPLCIAAFHGWLKDSGVEPPIESNRDGARGEASAAASYDPSPYARLTADAVADAEDVVPDDASFDPRAKPAYVGSGYVGRFAAGAETDSDSAGDRREFELVPLDPEGPRRVAAYEP